MANETPAQPSDADQTRKPESTTAAPQISLPKGGGALRGIGEKFSANPVTGTGSLAVPIAASSGREGFGPKLALNYDSGAGNGPFGLGWSLSLPAITRRTDKGLPRYNDSHADSAESDIFLISGAEDLVPVLVRDRHGGWIEQPKLARDGYVVKIYRPRTEGLFARLELWTRTIDGAQHWRSISRDNILTLYGVDHESRIADPQNPFRVFRWLIRASCDDKGNAIVYDYVRENDAGVDFDRPSESRRSRSANLYVRRIRYGNRAPLRIDPACSPGAFNFVSPDFDAANWMFSVVFDYGEGRYGEALPDEEGRIFAHAHYEPQHPWPAREDAFSFYRSGFEIRTLRLCRRALMFHHFPEELGTPNCLVRSTAFDYRQDRESALIERVVQSGHKRRDDGGYLTRSLPPLDLTYTRSPLEDPRFDGFSIVDVDPASLANLPAGVDGERYRWLDLDGEGIAGVLSEQGDAWFYKHNLGKGRFGAMEAVRTAPLGAQLNSGRRQLMDVAGDGNLDLVDFSASSPGYFQRTPDAGWGGFRAFRSLPNINWQDPNLRFLDLTGDGIADVLVTEDDAFVWSPSLLEQGFGEGLRIPVPWREDEGPRVVFADGTQSINIADMSGDGLLDILRIRNGEVCYWPNIGYGRFGAKITMEGAPWFDEPDLFDQRRIRLADTDGSGATDILYLKPDCVEIYLNCAGNGFSAARRVSHFPANDNLASVSVADFLGRGTACLLWSSPLPNEAGRQLRYIDLMCGRRPRLLASVNNNLGAETRIDYASSTEFYLADKAAGTPWITKLPFPVHVVSRVETFDLVSRNRFVVRYSYHHGFYDGLEREFRGFARVDQLDSENIASLDPQGGFPTGDNFDEAANLPPVLTKSWFHTGVFLAGGRVSRQLAHEYYDAANIEQAAPRLDDTILPDGLMPFEAREACRALKGSMLRQEVYALDGSAKAQRPYTIVENNFSIVALQPRGANRYMVFFTHPRETITLSCERDLGDPRVSQALTLRVDEFGNVLKAASIGYARRHPAFDEQARTLATLTESRYTNAVEGADAYRTPAPAEVRTYELTAPRLTGAEILDFATISSLADQAEEIAYDASPTPGRMQKRLIERLRTLYRRDDLAGLLPQGNLQSLALPGETCKLAFTPGLLGLFEAKASAGEVRAILAAAAAGYRDMDGDGALWIPSGRVFYSPNAEDDPAQELDFARAHFFLAHRYENPFGAVTGVAYDAPNNLSPVFSRDPVGNETKAEIDYSVLQPKLVTDPHGNRAGARFDPLGMLAGAVVQGKADGPVEGDSFDEFAADLTPRQIKRFFEAADPRELAVAHLGTATSRLIYDFDRTPVCAASIVRETHVSDLAQGQKTRTQMHFVYSDGFGRVAQAKVQAEPGPLDLEDPEEPIHNPRWIGTGATIYNNKGKPVRQYEPFFCPTPHFGVETRGVSNVLFYDPLERVVATLHPDATYEKVAFDAWKQATYDANDTVAFDPANDPDVGDFFRRIPASDYHPTWLQRRIDGALGPCQQAAAEKTLKHADTPTRVHFDSLGRPFLTFADNGRDEQGGERLYRTLSVLDIEGNLRAVIDALGRVAMRYDYNMLGARIRQASMEAGEVWRLDDVVGKPIGTWNSRGYSFRTEYDLLRRPLRSYVKGGDSAEAHAEFFPREILFERTIYGDSPDTGLSEAERRAANLRGKIFRHFDGAGAVLSDLFDFKGNMLRSSRQFSREYRNVLDWSRDPELEGEDFATASAYDALNRAIAVTAPDQSVYRPTFNDASLLEKVEVNLRGTRHHGEPVWTPFVHDINYDAKGQRTIIRYANGAVTTYEHDDKTFRLIRLTTTRASGPNGLATQIFRDAATAQDLRYTFDPVGNITRIEDAALRTTFHANQRVDPAADYTYDPIYRLIEATGREHIGQSAFAFKPPDGNDRDYPFVGAADLNDLQALRHYVERYDYDAAGNFREMAHRAANANWTRAYAYDEASLIDPARQSNRLSHTALQTHGAPIVEPYGYDAHGNIAHMPHLPLMAWNFRDELCASARQATRESTPETTFYVYDAAGQRARKVTQRSNGSRRNERLYVGGFEVYREYDASGAATLARETLHVMDDKRRIAIVETRTIGEGTTIAAPKPVLRYQLANHLGFACLELDETGELISYEEYSPYGNTAFQAGRNAAEVSLKRYRYAGQERDEENGFTYHGARYYAPWLGRWTAADPVGIAGGINLFLFSHNNPIVYCDPSGTTPEETRDLLKQIQQLFRKNLALVQAIFDDPRHIGTYAAWLTEGAIKDIFGPTAAGNVPYSRSSRVSVDVKIPGTKTAVDLKKSEKAIRTSQNIRQTATAQEGEEILAKVMPTKLKTNDYSGGLTKAERGAASKAAQDIRDWSAAAPERKAALLAGKGRGGGGRGGGGGQRGSATVGLLMTLATVASIFLILASSPDARSFAKATAGTVLVGQAVEKATLAAVGAKGATRVIGLTAGFALSLCGDQGGACERQETEEAINKRIQEEFPDAYTGRHCTLWGALCIVAETSSSFGPGYQEARATVIQEFNEEYKAEQAKIQAAKAKAEECSPLHGAGAGSYSTPDPALVQYCR
jgi:RHS repeat-associated protein